MGMFDRFIKTEQRSLENPNIPVSADNFLHLMGWDQEDASKRRKVGFVREIVNIEDAWRDNATQDANNVEFLAHTIQQKIEHTYRGDLADRSSIFSPLPWYENRAEMWPAFSNNGINAHLIVGVQFFRAKVQSGYGQKAYGEGAFGETSMQEIITDEVLKDLSPDEKAHLHKLQKRVTDAFLATQKAGSPDDIEAQMQWMQEQIAELEKKADG
ncbi:hypothetical protein OAN58_03030 [Paracoccaceae bacterium]|nr:hypothetical protein [Paracoccaceae bacterium]